MSANIKTVLCTVVAALGFFVLSACSHQAKQDAVAALDTPGPLEHSTVESAYFDYNSSELTDKAKDQLNQAASWMKGHPRTYYKIEGNTDERGSAAYNKALGERRAKAVRDYLISRGVDGTHIGIVSNGAATPIDRGHNEAAWARNRRAVPVVVDPSELAR